MAKKFFYVCAGVFLLALSYHLGARNATAQTGSMVSGFSAVTPEYAPCLYVMTPNGDVYSSCGPDFSRPPNFVGNFWGGGPTPVRPETWGSVKARYR